MAELHAAGEPVTENERKHAETLPLTTNGSDMFVITKQYPNRTNVGLDYVFKHYDQLLRRLMGIERFDPDALSIEEEIEAIGKDVPASEWEKLPADLSDNLDHYVYGTPKK